MKYKIPTKRELCVWLAEQLDYDFTNTTAEEPGFIFDILLEGWKGFLNWEEEELIAELKKGDGSLLASALLMKLVVVE